MAPMSELKWKGGTHEDLLDLVRLQNELIEGLRVCSSELDEHSLIQNVVDCATKITRASFGAFFHQQEEDETFSLYALCGADAADFANFPPIVKTNRLFAPTFLHGKVVRAGDVKHHSNYGKGAHGGPPSGHPEVVSYMAVPVMREHKIFGALLFSHPAVDHFTSLHEKAVMALADQASVALANAFLFRKAQDAIRMREDFLSIAAHEIRTPLTPLSLQIQFMRDSVHKLNLTGRQAEVTKKSLDICARQVKRLTGMIEELLDVSRIRVGKFLLKHETFDLVAAANDLAERYHIQAQESGGFISVAANADEVFLHADKFRMSQVLMNIVSNALKYAPGSPIEIGILDATDTVNIRVRDFGPGIPPEDQERIFNRFERADDGFKRGGLGLGLYLGREIVMAHGGQIHVASEVGKGCTFSVSIPKKKVGANGANA